METFEYVVLEENKTTGFTRVIGTFDSLEEAEPFWKAIAFKNIDEYELWHRIKKVKKTSIKILTNNTTDAILTK